MTWKREPIRHSLASKGFKTKIDDLEEYDVEKIREILEPYTLQDNPYIDIYGWGNPWDNHNKKISYPEDEVINHRFHMTDIHRLDSITEEGLLPDKEKKWGDDSFDAVFFNNTPYFALTWKLFGYHISGHPELKSEGDAPFALLRIDSDEFDDEEDWKYGGVREGHGEEWYLKERIPPELIEIKTRAGWMDLKDYVELREEYL